MFPNHPLTHPATYNSLAPIYFLVLNEAPVASTTFSCVVCCVSPPSLPPPYRAAAVGPIPTELGKLSTLQYLNLGFNGVGNRLAGKAQQSRMQHNTAINTTPVLELH